MVQRLPLHSLSETGAIEGDLIVFDSANNRWAPASLVFPDRFIADQGEPGAEPWPVTVENFPPCCEEVTANQGTAGAEPWPVTIVNEPGDPGRVVDQGEAGEEEWEVTQDSGEYEWTHAVATVTAAGPTVVYTPAPGMRVRVRWIYAMSNPAELASPLVRVLIGAQEFFRVFGGLSKRQQFTGAVGQPLIVDLSETGAVAVTAILEEVP